MHHVKDEYAWFGEGDIETFPFHPQELCGCGKCETNDSMHCTQRKAYKSTMVLSCPLHLQLYQIECKMRADETELNIHPDL